MANMFALILAIATLITGVIWLLEKLRWAPYRRKNVEAARVNTDYVVDGQALAKMGYAPVWIEFTASYFPILAMVFIVRSFIYEPFQIPSGSMMPTLLIGDFILVEKYAYGIKEPFNQTTLIKTGIPKRGDVAVFKYPQDLRLDYIKRIVGLPGDVVVYDPIKKTISITATCNQTINADSLCPSSQKLTYQPVEMSDFIQGMEQQGPRLANRFYQLSNGQNIEQLASYDSVRLDQRQELLGEQQHSILLDPSKQSDPMLYFRQQGSPISTWIVPNGHYFVMGDNRDNSSDSRYWGFVPEKNLVGKATIIWMSFKKQEGQWPTGVRLSRIGAIH